MRRVAALLAALLLAAGCADDAEETASTTLAKGRGVTVELPPGWRLAREALTPELTEPREAISVGTFPMRFRERDCAHIPISALEDLGPRGAFVSLQERGRGAGRFPARPAMSGPELGGPSEARDCIPHARFRDHWFEFEDAGRKFHAQVAFGPETSPETQDEAWAILDGLVVDPAVRPDWDSVG